MTDTVFLRRNYALLWLFLLATLCGPTWAQSASYLPYKTLSQTLTDLGYQHADLVQVTSLVRGASQQDVWLVTLGTGTEQEERPAMLVVAGIEGNDLIGSSITLAWLKQLLDGYGVDQEVTQLLKTTTFYVIPCLHPDAADRFFADCLVERPTSDLPVDEDHDGLIDEDGPEDLNGDGVISWMRIADPEGEYILDSQDPRLLVKADPLKGQAGAWRYLTEGVDNDQDDQWNEDGPGGVNFNRNFPYNHRFFAPDAGIHQVSEIETKALADFVIAHPQIGLVVTYGAADNLLKTPKGSEPKRKQPMTDIDKEDVGYYQALGKTYRQVIGLKKELENQSQAGSFSDWMYYHRGRLSLAICPWSPVLAAETIKEESSPEPAPADSNELPVDVNELSTDANESPADVNTPNTKEGSHDKEDDKDNKEARKQLRWFDQHVPEAFIPWSSFAHPDFPDQQVEIGGYRPFALTNPPASLAHEVATQQAQFLTEAAQTLPRMGVRKASAKHLGSSVFEIEIEIENTGFLPTILSHGQRTREVFPTRLELDVPKNRLLSGEKKTRLKSIEGSGGVAKARFILHAADRHEITFKVVSMLAGHVEGRIKLNTDSSRSIQDDPNEN
ncbi:M14 family metallopeptidase [Planctomycetota bacterium]